MNLKGLVNNENLRELNRKQQREIEQRKQEANKIIDKVTEHFNSDPVKYDDEPENLEHKHNRYLYNKKTCVDCWFHNIYKGQSICSITKDLIHDPKFTASSCREYSPQQPKSLKTNRRKRR